MYKLRKKYQRQFNKKIRTLNKDIVEDNLWKGRFEFRQKECEYKEFADGSGATLHIILRGYDKKTKYYKDYWLDYAPWSSFNNWHIWKTANDFIVNDAKVWEVEERPTIENAVNYTKEKMPDNVMKKEYNFF